MLSGWNELGRTWEELLKISYGQKTSVQMELIVAFTAIRGAKNTDTNLDPSTQ
jgi:hypothetical protein